VGSAPAGHHRERRGDLPHRPLGLTREHPRACVSRTDARASAADTRHRRLATADAGAEPTAYDYRDRFFTARISPQR
jgi:hypothetical protein